MWQSQPLVVEFDGYAFHRDRASFERDRRRDASLQLAGYRVLRITHRRLLEQPGSVVADRRGANAPARPASPPPRTIPP